MAYDSAMIDRTLAGICALAAMSGPAVFAQATQQGVFQVVPASRTHVPRTLDAAGRILQLQAVEETEDPDRPYYHYETATIRNEPEGYARFVISGDSIVGTLVTHDATYRVLPATDGRPLAVHLLARSNDPAVRLRLISEPWARAQELRHVQMEWLAHMKPRHVAINDGARYFSVRDGNFGKLAAYDAASVNAALSKIAELIWAPTPLDLQIVQVVPMLPEGKRVEFRQKIRGIPLSQTNSVTADAGGTIVDLATQFVDPARAGNRRVIPEAEGLAAALEQIAIDQGAPVTAYKLIQPTTLFYSVEGDKLFPYYTFNVAPQSRKPAVVLVNAHTGAARVLVNPDL